MMNSSEGLIRPPCQKDQGQKTQSKGVLRVKYGVRTQWSKGKGRYEDRAKGNDLQGTQGQATRDIKTMGKKGKETP